MSDTECHYFQLTPARKFVWRVGVKSADGCRSATFKIFGSHSRNQPRADIYISGRGMRGRMKVSIHASGARQVGLTSDFVARNPMPDGRSRHHHRWEKRAGTDLEYILRFPTDHLVKMPEPTNGKAVQWLSAAPAGWCLELGLYISEPMDSLNAELHKAIVPVACEKLTDNRYVLLVAARRKISPHDNQEALLADIRRRTAGREFKKTTRLLVGFRDHRSIRGWVDYSAQHFLTANASSE